MTGTAVLLLVTGISTPAAADETGPVPADTFTHQTRLETSEENCSEITIPRAANLAATDALVPEDYTVAVFGAAARVRIIDYVCSDVVVDRQRHSRPTHVSIGAAQLSARLGQPAPGTFYVLWLGTDNPVLAARYRQVGIASEYLSESSSTSETLTDGTFRLGLSYLRGDTEHTISSTAPSEPVPVPSPGSGVTLFHQGDQGEVVLSYDNTEIATTSGLIAGDLTGIKTLVQVIALPALLTLNGTVPFPGSTSRGTWTSSLVRTSATATPP